MNKVYTPKVQRMETKLIEQDLQPVAASSALSSPKSPAKFVKKLDVETVESTDDEVKQILESKPKKCKVVLITTFELAREDIDNASRYLNRVVVFNNNVDYSKRLKDFGDFDLLVLNLSNDIQREFYRISKNDIKQSADEYKIVLLVKHSETIRPKQTDAYSYDVLIKDLPLLARDGRDYVNQLLSYHIPKIRSPFVKILKALAKFICGANVFP